MSYEDDNFDKSFQDHDVVDDDVRTLKSGDNNVKVSATGLYADSHFHKEKRAYNKVWEKDGKYYKFVNIGYYSSAGTGARIRDAISGEYSRYLVGSAKQQLFFKVVIATGLNKNGPLHLYYASPEQYETHQYTTVDDNIKQQWYEKYNAIVNN